MATASGSSTDGFSAGSSTPTIPRSTASRSADALSVAREAVTGRRKLRFTYANAAGATTDRVVRPLGVFFWGRTWTLAAWCEMRNDFRNFRLDRATDSTMLPEAFDEEPGKSLKDLLMRYGPQAVKLLES